MWDQDIFVSVITAVGVPVEEELSYIGMNVRIVVMHLECDGEE